MSAPDYDPSLWEEAVDESVPPLDRIDCKDYAIRYATEHHDLSPVRGYALFDFGFTEHWWLATKAGKVVDITALRSLLGGVPEYVALPKARIVESTCDALDGPCESKPRCEWCVVRSKLERRGNHRLWHDELTHRLMFDRLFRENAKMRAQLRKLKGKS